MTIEKLGLEQSSNIRKKVQFEEGQNQHFLKKIPNGAILNVKRPAQSEENFQNTLILAFEVIVHVHPLLCTFLYCTILEHNMLLAPLLLFLLRNCFRSQ